MTETDIVTILSGSLLGDYPPVIDDFDANINAIEIFKKLLDIDTNGGIESSYFHISNTLSNPSSAFNYQEKIIRTGREYLDKLTDEILPGTIGPKLSAIIDPNTLSGITSEVRVSLLKERDRLAGLFNSMANVPVVFANTITD